MKKLLMIFAMLMAASVFATDWTWTDSTTKITWSYIVNSDNSATITSYASRNTGDVSVPSTIEGHPVVSIGNYALTMKSKVVSVVIPSGVVSIGREAFRGCERMTSITIPSSVTQIDSMAFSECVSLCVVTIPPKVYQIEEYTFHYCKTLTHVMISDGVVVIGAGAFNECQSLSYISIPKSVEYIETDAFSGCCCLSTVNVAKGDRNRVKKMLNESGFDTRNVKFIVENDSEPEPGFEEYFEAAHTFNGIVYDDDVMCGIIQISTTKKSAKGDVKVSGLVVLGDGKKQTIKSITCKVEDGEVCVTSKVGRLGDLELTITDDGFSGFLGDMAVESDDIGEETGIISGTLKMSYFDAKTGKVKTKNITIKGLTNGEAANISATVKGQGEKFFEAKFVE